MFQRLINVTVIFAIVCGLVLWFAVSHTMGNAVSALLIDKLSAIFGVSAATTTAWTSSFAVPFLVGVAIFYLGRLSVGAGVKSHRDKREIREQMALFMEEGRGLMAGCANVESDAPETESNEWAAKVETFLAAKLDNSYIARFRNGSGLPTPATTIWKPSHRNLWGGLHVRLARLQEFIKELSQ